MLYKFGGKQPMDEGLPVYEGEKTPEAGLVSGKGVPEGAPTDRP